MFPRGKNWKAACKSLLLHVYITLKYAPAIIIPRLRKFLGSLSLLTKKLILVGLCLLISGIGSMYDTFFHKTSVTPTENEYWISIGPVSGSITAAYTYASLFNPAGSGKAIVAKRIRFNSDAVAAAVFQDLYISRTSAASAGTQITAANIPKKNSDTVNPIAEVRHTGVTTTFVGTASSRLMAVVAASAAGNANGGKDYTFNNNQLVLQPGEGIALHQTVAGDIDQRIRLAVEWEEVASTPSAANDFMLAFPRVENAAAVDYKYQTLFNPAASGKSAVVSRLNIDIDCDTTAVYSNQVYIRRISAASVGTQIASADIPKKHTGGANSIMDARHTGVTATLTGTVDSSIGEVTPCGAANQPGAHLEIIFGGANENLVLQPGEGIALTSSAAGDIDQLIRLSAVWSEQASAPASQGEYAMTIGPVSGSTTAGYNYATYFNPVGSGKTAVVRKIGVRADAIAAAAATNVTVQRISAASVGTQILAANIPKKHSGTADTIMDVRSTGVTVTKTGGTNARILSITTPSGIGQVKGQLSRDFGVDSPLVLQPGEGIVLYQEGAGNINHRFLFSMEWDEEAVAPAQNNAYMMSIGPINGSTTSGYNYATFFNPAASGKTVSFERLGMRIDAAAASLYVPMTIQRISAASLGTAVTTTDIPKKHSSTVTSIMDVRTTGVTATKTGGVNARINSVTSPGAIGTATATQVSGYSEYDFDSIEEIVLQPGEGIVVYQEAAGDLDMRVRLTAEWKETASTPSSQGEYVLSTGPVTGNATANQTFISFFNPAASTKNYVVNRVEIRVDRTGTGTAYVPIAVRRLSAATGGTLTTATDIPKKHSGTSTSGAEVRTLPTATTYSLGADSKYMGVTTPGAAGQDSGLSEAVIISGDELVLAPGEGIGLYQEAAGDTGLVIRMRIVWSEPVRPVPAYDQSSYRFFDSSNSTTPLAQAWGGTASDQAKGVAATSDGGYATVGTTSNFGGGSFIAKYDKYGQLGWNRTLSGVSGTSIITTSDGGYAIGGFTGTFGAGGNDMFMAKYDSSGNLSWSRTWGTTGGEDVGGIVQTTDGGYVLAGSVSTGGYDMATVKLTSAGALEWARTWGTSSGFDFATGVTATSDGGVAVTGQTALGSGSGDVFVVKYSSTGTLTWSRAWGGTGVENSNAITQTSDGGYAVVGDTLTYGTSSTADMLAVKFDSTGTMLWARTWGGTGVESSNTITQASDGDLIIGAQTESFGNGGYDLALVRYSSAGTLELSKTFGGTAADIGKSVAIDLAGNYVLVGYGLSYGAGGDDALITQFSTAGSMTNCSSPICQSPTPTTSSPTAAATTPAPTTSSPVDATAAQSPTTGTPSATVTAIISGAAVLAGNPLATQNTAAQVSAAQTPFRLRSRVAVSTASLAQSGQSMKLQYAEKSGVCDVGFSGETYQDMAAGPLVYHDNTSIADATAIVPSADDPTNASRPAVPQVYRETDPFTNAVAVPTGSDSLWDFSLTSSAAAAGKTYCIRIVKSDSSLLDTYSQVPEVTIGPANAAPLSPSALTQKTPADSPLVTGQWHNANSIKFSATASDADTTDMLQLCVETDILGVSFSGTEDACGTAAAYTGLSVPVSVTIAVPTVPGEYHWQARIKDAGGLYSSWTSYDINLETARDFGIDTAAPSATTVYDGVSNGIDASVNDGSLSALSANWTTATDATSGINRYEYAIGTSAGGSTVQAWTSTGTSTSVTATGLVLKTSERYFFSVRSYDNAGNYIENSSDGILVAPSVSFAISPATISFSNLKASNSYTDSQTTTLTTSTNAYGGYVVRSFVSDLLRSASNRTINSFTGGTYASPDNWETGDIGFGYTSSDTSVQGVDKFQAATCPGGSTKAAPGCFAPFNQTAPGDIVADHTTAVNGTPIANQQFTLTYRISTLNTQSATQYNTNIIYTITPVY